MYKGFFISFDLTILVQCNYLPAYAENFQLPASTSNSYLRPFLPLNITLPVSASGLPFSTTFLPFTSISAQSANLQHGIETKATVFSGDSSYISKRLPQQFLSRVTFILPFTDGTSASMCLSSPICGSTLYVS